MEGGGGGGVNGGSTSGLPLLSQLREMRRTMQDWLEANGERGVGLRKWVRAVRGVRRVDTLLAIVLGVDGATIPSSAIIKLHTLMMSDLSVPFQPHAAPRTFLASRGNASKGLHSTPAPTHTSHFHTSTHPSSRLQPRHTSSAGKGMPIAHTYINPEQSHSNSIRKKRRCRSVMHVKYRYLHVVRGSGSV